MKTGNAQSRSGRKNELGVVSSPMENRHPSLANSVRGAIGNTPLVELGRRVEPRGLSGRLLVKLEYFSPGGSKKVSIALEIIREARASGVRTSSMNSSTGRSPAATSLSSTNRRLPQPGIWLARRESSAVFRLACTSPPHRSYLPGANPEPRSHSWPATAGLNT